MGVQYKMDGFLLKVAFMAEVFNDSERHPTRAELSYVSGYYDKMTEFALPAAGLEKSASTGIAFDEYLDYIHGYNVREVALEKIAQQWQHDDPYAPNYKSPGLLTEEEFKKWQEQQAGSTTITPYAPKPKPKNRYVRNRNRGGNRSISNSSVPAKPRRPSRNRNRNRGGNKTSKPFNWFGGGNWNPLNWGASAGLVANYQVVSS
jgi:hypothetical protein